MQQSDSGWQRATKREPCKVCEADSWCLLSADGSTAICMRIKSDRPKTFRDETVGFIHKLSDNGATNMKIVARVKKPRVTDTELHNRFAPLCRNWYVGNGDKVNELARMIGVPVWTLDALMVGWDGQAWTIPERNHRGLMIGVNRRLPDGSKTCVIGSRRGLTFADGWDTGDGPVFIVEGASDVAAGLAMELAVIGRPSNVGGVDYLARMLDRVDRRIVIVGERDRKDHDDLCEKVRDEHDRNCDGCRLCWPGKSGAVATSIALSRRLNRIVEWSMVPDGAKDLRAWFIGRQPALGSRAALRKLGESFIRRMNIRRKA